MLYLLLAIYAYFLAINAGTFMAFAYDKNRARSGARRLPEVNLLALAAAGGWLGAKMGQKVFRHKSQKQPFTRVLNFVPLGHVAFGVLALAALAPVAN